MNEYFAWEYQKDGQEIETTERVTTMLYMNRRAKIKLIKKMAPEYQVENLKFSDYTADELSEIWQDDELLEPVFTDWLIA